jgi:hypothetical protein
MVKKPASFVLASLRGSTYLEKVCLASSLAAASLGGLFDHPAGQVSLASGCLVIANPQGENGLTHGLRAS